VNHAPAKVFLPHPVTKMTDSGLVSKFPLAPAARYGELFTIFGDSGLALMPDAALDAIRNKLSAEDFAPERDYFVVAGDPTIFALMIESALVHWGARPKLLRWDRLRRDYDVVPGKTYQVNGEHDEAN
jgi:hypothetical protein